ncbi:hypothetical protein DVH24_011112 [Malus domestica]|uniref:Uncharacterized protein n=1 Tax=Malus domestica TaxID=3750 RepID=A0A498JV17_MALDO|nr:hypothetical protein DVH24_011112 [Malus domestica]
MEGLVASRREKLASVPSGGGAVAYSAPAVGGGGGTAAPAATEQKNEEKVEEKEESYDNMGFPICPEIPKLFRDSRNLGFPKFWFGIGLEIGIPKNFGLGIGTWFSVRYPIPNQP